VGDVREVIRDASMGWLVAPGDADALKDALSEAYDLWKKDQLSIKGHHLRTFASRFSIEKQSQSVLVFYNEIMAEHRK
jgi:glycosyltransferase involved in cell wall biosynthesis